MATILLHYGIGDNSGTDHLRFKLMREISRKAPMAKFTESDPLYHTQNMQQRLQEIVTHLRDDIDKVDEPQFKAMFETSAEVLEGIIKAFRDYEQKSERAWQASR